MDDLTLLAAKAAVTRLGLEKAALSPRLVDRAMRSAARRGVSDQRVQQLLGKTNDWMTGALGRSRAIGASGRGVPYPAWLGSPGPAPGGFRPLGTRGAQPRPEMWGIRGGALTRALGARGEPGAYDELVRLARTLANPMAKARLEPASPLGQTYGRGPAKALARAYDLPAYSAIGREKGWSGKGHPEALPDVAPYHTPTATVVGAPPVGTIVGAPPPGWGQAPAAASAPAPQSTPLRATAQTVPHPGPAATGPGPQAAPQAAPGGVWRARALTGAGGAGFFGLGNLAARLGQGEPEAAPAPAAPLPPPPAPQRQGNLRVLGDRARDLIGSWWSRMQQRYRGAAS